MFPIHLNLGFKVIYFYEGFYFLIAISVATLVALRRVRKAGLDVEAFTDGLVWALLGAFLGARVFHFLFWDWSSFLSDPWTFFRFWEGGVSITGGLAGGALGGFIYFRRRHVDFFAYFAAASPAVLLGQAIGRVGCFLNGDAWGIPTSLPWGISEPKFGTFVPSFLPDHQVPSWAWIWSVNQGYNSSSDLSTVPLHPTQLYESLGDLLLAGMVILLAQSLSKQDGSRSKIFWLHLGGYSLLRFGLEFLHGDREATVWAGMTALQMGLLGFAMLSSVLFVRSGRTAVVSERDLPLPKA